MSIYAIGLNHTTAPLALREQLAYASHELGGCLSDLKHQLNAEVALLSTCNRTELYFAHHTPEIALSPQATLALLTQATHYLAHSRQVSPALLAKHTYSLQADQTIRHAYKVASGLDSMVLGETQILGQLKDAVRHAQAVGTLGTSLQHLFQQSFAVAKAVRTQTGVGAASVSLAAAAVRLAQKIFGEIAERTVLMIGAGEMIELCATHFASHRPRQLTIANRSLDKAQALIAPFLKQGHCVQAIDLAQLPEVLGQYDIVLSCTASTLPVIGLDLVQRALAFKASKRLPQTTMMVDLAVPRDIEGKVGQLGDVYLYTIDDLGRVVQAGQAARSAAVVQAEQMIEAKVHEFLRWQSARRGIPIVQTLQHQAHSIRQTELDKALRQLALGENPTYVLEQLSRQLTQKLLYGSLHLTQQLAADPSVHSDLLETVARSYMKRR